MTLYIVATPIGNLEDITFRALRILKEANLIVAEDTRHTLKLLNHFDIHTPLTSFFEHNEKIKVDALIAKLKEGQTLALVSDAGTPGISDPGFRLIAKAVAEKITVVPIPGPCAAIAALVASGLPTDHFFFVGFLPEKPGKRKSHIASLKPLSHTLVFYLSRWKAVKHLQELAEFFGERRACLGREITKLHEEFLHGTLADLALRVAAHPPKGEMTLVVEGASD